MQVYVRVIVFIILSMGCRIAFANPPLIGENLKIGHGSVGGWEMFGPEKLVTRSENNRLYEIDNKSALELYKLDNGIYPTTDQGLMALVKKPTTSPVPSNWKGGGYVKDLPMDPWNKPYQYKNPGAHGEIDIFSYGSSGQTSATGAQSTMIGNWSAAAQ